MTSTACSRYGATGQELILDLSANYEVNDNIKITGGVRNVFDSNFIVSRHPYGPRVNEPRAFYGGVTVSF